MVFCFPSLILICSVSLALGLFFTLKPSQAIDIQKRFYLKINWRIEPVDMALEIRNTRIMGLMVVAVAVFSAGYLLICGLK
ncbi:MAG: hypothetical protein HQL12_06100 [Candidatus Omnitrophica bacterium]|nr:hypothetical protein [Candidatus Omnitrophota bacterium]